MKTNLTAFVLAILAAGSSYAQPKPEADAKFLSDLRIMALSSYDQARTWVDLADDTSKKPILCALAEGPVLAAEAFASAVLSGARGIAAASQGQSGTIPLPSADGLINKSGAQKSQREMAPVVAKINASHKNGEPVTLEQIKKNLNLLKEERDKVFATDLNGSFKNSVKDHLTCRSLSIKGTAKLAEIAVTEFDYLSTVYRALKGGFTPRLAAFPYERTQTYESILADLQFMNHIYLDPQVFDVRQSNRTTSSTRSQEGSAASTQKTSGETDSKARATQ